MKSGFRINVMIKLLLKIVMVYFIFVFSGFILLVAVYALPTTEMKKNVARSSELYNYEGVYPQIVTGYKSSQLDNYSDAYMLANAIYQGSGNIIQEAMTVNRIEYRDMSMPMSLTNYANGVDLERGVISYSRYWHGYLVILKPLLLFFDVADIKMINMVCQTVLIFIILAMLIERKEKKYAVAFLMLILLLNPLAVSVSIHFSAVFYISMLLFLLIWKEPVFLHKDVNRILLFFVTGMLTSFFDQFTYPLISLGLPLTALLVSTKKEKDWKQQTTMVIVVTVFWGLGYLGMWGAKAVLGSLLTDQNIIANFFNQAHQYTITDLYGDDRDMAATLWRNVKVLLRWPYVFAFGGAVIYLLLDFYRGGAKKLTGKWFSMIPFLLVMCLPLGDMLFPGHSFDHYWFSYREFGITLFAGYCMLIAFLKEDRVKN